MNEPFLLSNLVELQDLDNKIYKLIDSKSNGENVLNLKSLEINYKELTKKISGRKFDQEKLVRFLRKGSKAVMSAISHRNTVTKDTFMLTGFSDALSELEKRCKLN